jgi:hypothetical protein
MRNEVKKEAKKEDIERGRLKMEETKEKEHRTLNKKHSTQHILVYLTPLLPGFAR